MDVKRRARDYLAHLPPAISGCGGHNATFLAACWLVRFGLGDPDAMALLCEFNERCQPPWTGRELAHKLADARKIVGPTLPNPAGPAAAVRQTWSLEPYRIVLVGRSDTGPEGTDQHGARQAAARPAGRRQKPSRT